MARSPFLHRVLGALALASLIASQSATGSVLDTYGAFAVTETFDCVTAATCNANTVTGPENGQLLDVSATSLFPDDGRGTASATATLDPNLGLATPTLQAAATSTSANGGASGFAGVLEVYTNTSLSVQDYVLSATLTATVTDGDVTDLALPLAFATLSVISVTNAIVNPADSIDDVINSLLGNLNFAAAGFLVASPFSLPGPNSTDLSFSLQPGESAYFAGLLTATAPRTLSVADAGNTLTTSFTGNTTGLQSASTSSTAPEPSTVALIVAGCLLLGFRPRRLAQSR